MPVCSLAARHAAPALQPLPPHHQPVKLPHHLQLVSLGHAGQVRLCPPEVVLNPWALPWGCLGLAQGCRPDQEQLPCVHNCLRSALFALRGQGVCERGHWGVVRLWFGPAVLQQGRSQGELTQGPLHPVSLRLNLLAARGLGARGLGSLHPL